MVHMLDCALLQAAKDSAIDLITKERPGDLVLARKTFSAFFEDISNKFVVQLDDVRAALVNEWDAVKAEPLEDTRKLVVLKIVRRANDYLEQTNVPNEDHITLG